MLGKTYFLDCLKYSDNVFIHGICCRCDECVVTVCLCDYVTMCCVPHCVVMLTGVETLNSEQSTLPCLAFCTQNTEGPASTLQHITPPHWPPSSSTSQVSRVPMVPMVQVTVMMVVMVVAGGGDNGRGQDWVGRLCWTETVIGGQCWDNTPIVEDNGGCVPLELDGRGRGGLASLSYALGPLLYLMYCVVPEPQRSEALLGLRGTQYYKDNILSFHCW